MKFRTDFVTNSSSSSFIAVTVTKNDGEEVKGQASMGSGYHENPILYFDLKEEDVVKEAIDKSSSGIELCNQIYDRILDDFHSVHDDLTAIRDVENLDDVSLINIMVRQEGSSSGKVSYTYDMSKKEGSWSYEQVEYDYYDLAQEEKITPMYDGVPNFNEKGELEIKDGVLTDYRGPGGVVVIPNGVVGIGRHAFAQSNVIKKIIFPSSLKFIDVGAFSRCSKLEKIEFNEGFECIGAKAFEFCGKLSEVNLPDTVVELGYKCFSGSGLKSIKIPEGVCAIKDSVFYDCEMLENVSIHSGVAKIGAEAFMGCDHLCEITFPEGVTELCDNVLWDCKMLQKINLPSTIKNFYSGQICFSSNVREINVSENSKHLKVVNGGLYTYDGKKLIKCLSRDKEFTIEDGTAYVGEYAFYQNKDLEKVNFPKSVKSIGIEAFCGCENLKEVNLPTGLLTIDYEAFHICRSLKTVCVPSTVKSDLEQCFDTYDTPLKIIRK